MKIGYARVSTDDQTLDLQRDALKRAKCREIYEEQVSGKSAARPQLEGCLKSLREGDTLIVWRLDRLGRTLADLVRLIAELEQRKINFESLTEKIETRSPAGRLVFHVFAALAEFERNLIRERTVSGLNAARERLAQLLNDPGARWMPRHVEVKDAPPVMRNNEEAVERAERECWHGEEVHRRNRFAMVIDECHPPLRQFGISRRLSHPAQHGALRDVEAKHFQFSVNARCTPGGIFGDHAEDEVAQFLGDAFSSCTGATPRVPRPIQLELRPVPANNGLRLNKDLAKDI